MDIQTSTPPAVDYDSPVIRAKVTERLVGIGYAVNPAVPNYTLADTLRRFQAATLNPDGSKLSVDGGLGPQTYTALFTAYVPKGETLRSRVLAVATAMVGVSEVPPGSNKGPQVSMWLRAVDVNSAAPWCMAFAWSAIAEAYRQMLLPGSPLPRTGSCMGMWRAAGKLGIKRITAAESRANPDRVLPGMLAIWLIVPATEAGHTGIVMGWQGDKMITVEGNSNENGSREGLIVARQTKRRLSDKILVGFIDPCA